MGFRGSSDPPRSRHAIAIDCEAATVIKTIAEVGLEVDDGEFIHLRKNPRRQGEGFSCFGGHDQPWRAEGPLKRFADLMRAKPR